MVDILAVRDLVWVIPLMVFITWWMVYVFIVPHGKAKEEKEG